MITLTLFGGMDRSLYDDMKATQDTGFWVACAEKTLRTWFHRADRKVGKVLEWKESDNPPLGAAAFSCGSGSRRCWKATAPVDAFASSASAGRSSPCPPKNE